VRAHSLGPRIVRAIPEGDPIVWRHEYPDAIVHDMHVDDLDFRPSWTAGKPTAVVNHFTGAEHALTWPGSLRFASEGIGSPFGIREDGTVCQYCDLDRSTWHARGESHFAVGIEVDAGPNHDRPVRLDQLVALARLNAWLCERFDIPAARMAGIRHGPGLKCHTDGLEDGGDDWNTAHHWDSPFQVEGDATDRWVTREQARMLNTSPWTWTRFIERVKAILGDESELAPAGQFVKGHGFSAFQLDSAWRCGFVDDPGTRVVELRAVDRNGAADAKCVVRARQALDSPHTIAVVLYADAAGDLPVATSMAQLEMVVDQIGGPHPKMVFENDFEDNEVHGPILGRDPQLLVDFTRGQLELARRLGIVQQVVIYTYPGGPGGPNFAWIRGTLRDAGLTEGPAGDWLLYAAVRGYVPGDPNTHRAALIQDGNWTCGGRNWWQGDEESLRAFIGRPPTGGEEELTPEQEQMLADAANAGVIARLEARFHRLDTSPGKPWRNELARIRAAAARKTLGVPDGEPTVIHRDGREPHDRVSPEVEDPDI
jgi:hypothetical protein